ncbi:MAG: hypothetical protein Q9Q40_15300 [Acidobacteriota bacterium]|nr:hypothetical protein [Acidobacteriota bacterium]
MAALRRAEGLRLLFVLFLLGCVLPLSVAEKTAPGERAPEALLADARTALEQADLETAEKLAQEVAARAASRDQLAMALDLVAQCRFTLGDAEGTAKALDRLIDHLPSYEVGGEIVGPRYVELYRSRREKKVGFFSPSCKPLPCEGYQVDGVDVRPGAGGKLAVTAGKHRVRLLRHGFEAWESGELEIAAGEHKVLEAELRQVARDLRFETVPAGVEVLLDGVVVGQTEAVEDDPATGRFELRELLPGEHLLVLRQECYQRLEQRLEIVLDALDPGPLDLGRIELQPARAELELRWNRSTGWLSLDGREVEAGRHEICPGRHRVALQLAGKRSWFEDVEIRDGERKVIDVHPRPTIALAAEGPPAVEAAARGRWNRVVLDAATAAQWAAFFAAQAPGGSAVPLYPAIQRQRPTGSSRPFLPEDVDLLVLVEENRQAIPATRRLLFFDPVTGILEQAAWPLAQGEQALRVAAARLAPRVEAPAAFVGFDVAGRIGRPPVISEVHPACPLEGLSAGEILLEVNGQALDPRDPVGDLERRVAAFAPLEPIELLVENAEGRVRRRGQALAQVEPPNPHRLGGGLLLARLAMARASRLAAEGRSRFLAALEEGMMLAALDLAEPAARLLDRTEIPADIDPSTDLRGTVWTVLESLLRRLGAGAYAAEIHARLAGLPEARFGGRRGPPLAYLSETTSTPPSGALGGGRPAAGSPALRTEETTGFQGGFQGGF